MANSVGPDQTLHSAASDLGLHCLQRPICPNTLGYYGIQLMASHPYKNLTKPVLLPVDVPKWKTL